MYGIVRSTENDIQKISEKMEIMPVSGKPQTVEREKPWILQRMNNRTALFTNGSFKNALKDFQYLAHDFWKNHRNE